ncbi:MAG: outer membrane protein transport protein [Betaproteobacteria bacterium]|jgi:long-chain fatty acid transport protein|nr:outer membrane protein transport protein [Betaproteobacteria bacterium]MBK6600276.1 outer membrane protein transport protein [Betaproteobacteria bacterium]
MNTPFRHSRIAVAVAGCALAFAAGQAQGAAFQLNEISGSGLGNAYAGGAAVAEDASTVWSNPAGMVRLPTMQAAAALHVITPSIQFNNNGSIAAFNQPLGHEGGDAGTHNYVPNMYFTVPVTKELFFGLGVNAPFGLVTWYGEGWAGRYQGIKSDLKVINVEPALAWKINNEWSVGAGINYQKIEATLTQATNYSAGMAQGAQAAAAAGAIPASLVPQIIGATAGLDGTGQIDGDDSAWGWNVGVLYNINSKQRIGAHYRSSIKYDVVGSVNFTTPIPPVPASVPAALAPAVGAIAAQVNASPTFANGGVNLAIELPPKFNLSYFGALDDRWDLMADVQWTGWSSIPEFKVVRNNGTVLTDQHWNYDDSWRFSGGANYHYNNQWMFRGGIAYDQTPTNDLERSVRLPDSDRVWLSAGAQYKWDKNWVFDVGFTYIIGQSASIDQYANATAASIGAYGKVKGDYDASVTILSGQVTYSF